MQRSILEVSGGRRTEVNFGATFSCLIIEYMNWLVHHEFGLNHKYFNLDKSKLDGDKSTLNYWLKIWINFYRYAEKIKDENTYFMKYTGILLGNF